MVFNFKFNYFNFIFALFRIILLSELNLSAKFHLGRILGVSKISISKFDPYRQDFKLNKTIEK